ncbi:PREDICTED: pentatricopeptide repeat-containing protein At2g17210 [Theobroma cacao]|uniref:Pentatricopeptide repeat-containing protein At2g17210 n=1 Tax=Theobroma cacao TaxID=3641 RepID=A0AB32VFF8_THECC|nr:PREDICTED: pentatricopeptide repeat-containing protein At2g17210 [Theobroma cacao]
MRFPTNLWGSKLPSWSLRIKESYRVGKWLEVFSHYQEMKRYGVHPSDPSVFPPILKACLNLSPTDGKSVHACLIKQGYQSFASIGNSIVDFYMKCGDLESALGAFDCMQNRDSVSWNIIIYGHLDQGVLKEGLRWFNKARVAGFAPNASTLVLVIQACRSIGAYHEGLEIHGYTIRSGLCAIDSIQNSLLSMYMDTDLMGARILFDEMCNKDVISWSVMIEGYVQIEEAEIGLKLFQEMVSEDGIQPDGVTTASVLKACARLEDIHMGKLVHGVVIRRGDNNDLFIGNTLIDMYSKCKDVDSAFQVYREMSQKNIVSWNSIISGFVLNEKYSEALLLFNLMGKEGVEVDEVTLVNFLQICKHFVYPSQCKSVHCIIIRQKYESNESVINSLIDAYAKCNLVDHAWKLFDGLKERDVVSWSTMVAGLAHCGKPDEAVGVFCEMSKTMEKPTGITIINLLGACSLSAELRRSKWAHGVAIRSGFAADVAVATAIVDMYAKCGAIDTSRKVFDGMPEKNVLSWSAMVAAYGMNGLPREALALLPEMKLQGLKPNSVTTLSALSACSHGGLIEEGLSFLKSMVHEYGTVLGLEHYSCVIDMLGRAGKLDSAVELINHIPDGHKAGASAWGAILSACRSHGNSELGAGALSHVLELEPMNSAGYLLGSSMYAAEGLWGSATRMRRLVKERGLTVSAGYSLVHVGDRAWRFLAGDCSNPRAQEVDIMVTQLHSCMNIDERIHSRVVEC